MASITPRGPATACRRTSTRRVPSAPLWRQGPGSLRPQRSVLVCEHPRAHVVHVHGLAGGFLRRLRPLPPGRLVHVADHHIAPGKKQWTWGNHEFGYAWDRNLTDSDGPYIELMAGVYTDNQPDFSFLQPGETKTWSQYWYPIQQIGPAQHANLDAAVELELGQQPGAVSAFASLRRCPRRWFAWKAPTATPNGRPIWLRASLFAWKVPRTCRPGKWAKRSCGSSTKRGGR